MENVVKIRIKSCCPVNGLRRSGTLPIYTTFNVQLKSKYKEKKVYHSNSSQKIYDNSEKYCLTRATTNLSNTQPIPPSDKKPKGRVKFVPDYKLVKHINFNPLEPIYKNNNNNQKEKEEEKEKKEKEKKEIKKEDNVAFQCTCILF